jgi:hypothetical protein
LAVELAGRLSGCSTETRRMRDALLPKLISGELRVHDAERLAAQAGV